MRRGALPGRDLLADVGQGALRGLRRGLDGRRGGAVADARRGGGKMTLARMAASYRHSAELLRQRMNELKEAAKTAEPSERSRLEQRVRDLSSLYRDTQETARFLERYYDRRYHAHGRRKL